MPKSAPKWLASLALFIVLLAVLAVAFAPGATSVRAEAAVQPLGGTPTATACPPAAWSVVDSPNPSGYNNYLFSVSALSSDDVWAVGYTSLSSQAAFRTHTQHWDGTQWTTVPSPNANSLSNILQGVYAVAPDNVWAVGYYYVPSSPSIYPQTLIMHWDGSAWAVVSSANASAWNNYLYSISGTGANDIWAVGYYDPTPGAEDYDRTLVLHYNGTAWSVVTSPNANGLHQELRGVDALSANDVWAVGSYTTPDSGQGSGAGTLALHYNGTQWDVVPSANGVGRFSLVYSVSGADPNNVWAVGYNNPNPGGPGNVVLALIIRWNGTAWVQDTNASPGTSTNFLNGVSAASAGNVWAVGTQNSGSGSRSLTLRYDGTQWSVEPSANAAGANYVQAVSNLGSEAWLVGYYGPAGGYRTLTDHYAAVLCGSPTAPAPSPTMSATSTFTPVPTAPASNTPTSTRTATTPVQTAVATSTSTPSATPSATATSTSVGASPTASETSTVGTTVTSTPTVCAIEFADVLPGNTFYANIRCLACRGIINGYPCGGDGEPCNGTSDPYFRPGSLISRGQLAKIVSQSAGFVEPVSGQTFEDVTPATAFYEYVERLASRGVMGGYACGVEPSEPCGNSNLPYFRPGTSASRGQLTKIVSNAAGFVDPAPATFTFTDVPVGSTFHEFVERLLINRPGAVNGYPCGGAGEPCDDLSRAYFRPNNGLSRGQGSKIVSNVFFPGCAVR